MRMAQLIVADCNSLLLDEFWVVVLIIITQLLIGTHR